MDRKSTIVLLISFVLILSWSKLVQHFYPPVPVTIGTNGVAGAAHQFGTNRPPPAADSSPVVPPVLSAAPAFVAPQAAEVFEVLENENARYTFSSHGGGLKLVELKKYDESPGKPSTMSVAPGLMTLNNRAPVPVMTLLGDEASQGDGLFALTKTDTGVRAEKQLPNGLTVVKEFKLGTNYLLSASVKLENRAAQPLVVKPQEWVVGTATPLNLHDDALMMGLYWYNGVKAEHVDNAWFANTTMGCAASVPRTEYEGGNTNILWAAVHNQFFTIAVVPQEPAPRIVSRRIDLPPPTSAQLAEDPKAVAKPFGFQTAFVYPAMVLAPHQHVERQFQIFAGPKEYNTLARLGDSLGNNLDLIMDFGGFFGFFAKALLLSMNALNQLGLPYGLAIIAITVIIKLVFWPLTNASTKSMKRMSALQPQMKALQEKYKDDPKKMNVKLMEFMKENKVSPLGGCLPMMLQIPVFFGFFTMIKSAIELRGAHFLWAADLSQPDTVGYLFGFPINPLPLIMGVTMLWQASVTPPSPGMDPTQQKIMKYMPMMFMVFLYNFSAGLTLYWTVQNLLTIAQMKLTKTDPPTAGAGTVPAKAVSVAPKKKK
jgi:YidC/Oxa1 family membrane protein insertase